MTVSTTRQRTQTGGHLGHQFRAGYIDVRELVVRHGESVRGPRIELFTTSLDPYLQPAGLAQLAVDVYRPRYLGDPVLGQRHYVRAERPGLFDERPAQRIHGRDLRGDARMVWTEALQVVVQVRQVDERERRRRCSRTCSALRAIQRLDSMSAPGPQKRNSGNSPRVPCSSSRSSAGCV